LVGHVRGELRYGPIVIGIHGGEQAIDHVHAWGRPASRSALVARFRAMTIKRRVPRHIAT
jgi:hypothetical protein